MTASIAYYNGIFYRVFVFRSSYTTQAYINNRCNAIIIQSGHMYGCICYNIIYSSHFPICELIYTLDVICILHTPVGIEYFMHQYSNNCKAIYSAYQKIIYSSRSPPTCPIRELVFHFYSFFFIFYTHQILVSRQAYMYTA